MAASAAGWLRYLPPLALAGVCAYLLAVIIGHVLFASPGYDDSWHGSIARNLAVGRGYVTMYGESVKKFDEEISVGPSLILPASLLYGVFGNHYWVNNLAAPLVSLPALGAVLWLLHRRFRASLAVLAVIVVMLALFANERADDGEIVDFLSYWGRLLGDVPAALMVVLAAVLASLPGAGRRRHLLAGIVIGLAFYLKLFVVFALPGFAVFYGWQLLRDRDLRPAALAVAGGMATVLAFEAFRLVHLGSVDAYTSNTRALWEWYRDWNETLVLGDRSNVRRLLEVFSVTFAVIPAAIWTALALGERARARGMGDDERARFQLSVILLVAAAAHLFWWWRINDSGWPRHALPALVYLSFGLPLLASLVKVPLVRYGGVAVAVIVLVSQADALTGGSAGLLPQTGKEPRLSALLETSSFLRSLDGDEVSFWGCGWWANRDLELVANVRMNDCTEMGSVRRHLIRGERLLQVRSEFYNWEGSAVLAELARECDRQKIFAAGPFVVCDATPWLAEAAAAPER